MSKLGDVQKMYGQDFGITVTNAPSSIIKSSSNLPKNMLLISSYFINGEDDGYPSLFATDYNGSPVQLTYAAYTGYNGLILDDKNRLSIYIDNKTIKSGNNLPLSVDSDELAFASQDKRGVVKVGNNLSQDDQRNINIEEEQEFNYDDEGNIKFDFEKTGIDIDSTGSLIISDSFIKYFKAYMEEYISKKALPLAERYKDSSPELNNLSGDINTGIYGAGDNNDDISILKPGLNSLYLNAINDQGYIKLKADLSFFSTSKSPISNIVLSCSGADVIQSKTETNLIKEDNQIKPYINLKDYKLYQHELTDIEFIFPPNYTFINNIPQEKMYNINISGLNTSAFTIYQNKLTSAEFYFELDNIRNAFTYKPSNTDDETPQLTNLRYNFNFNHLGLINKSTKIDLQYELKIYLGKTDSIILYDKVLDPQNIPTITLADIKENPNTLKELINRSVQVNGSSITIKSDAPKDGYCDLIITTNGEKSIIQNTFIMEHIRDISNISAIILNWVIESITVNSGTQNITETIIGGDLTSFTNKSLDLLLQDNLKNKLTYRLKVSRSDGESLVDLPQYISQVLYGNRSQNLSYSNNNNIIFSSNDNITSNLFNSIKIELSGVKYSLSEDSKDLTDIMTCLRRRVKDIDVVWLTKDRDGSNDDENLIKSTTTDLQQEFVFLYFNSNLVSIEFKSGIEVAELMYNSLRNPYYQIKLSVNTNSSITINIKSKDTTIPLSDDLTYELPPYTTTNSSRNFNTGDDENDQSNAREGNFDDDIQDDELA
jgi:hypothetical protein